MPTTLKKISFLTLLTYGFLLGALFIYTYFAYYGIEELIPTSPDENQTLFFTQQLSNKGTLIYVNPLNQVFSEKIFAPRNVAQVDEKTVPGSFLGYFIITSIFYNIHESLLLFVSPFFAVLSLIVIYKICLITFKDKKLSFCIALLVSVSPPFFFWSTKVFNNIPQLFFILLSIYYILKYIKDKHDIDILLASLVAIGAIWMRYVDLIFLLPLFGYAILLKGIKIKTLVSIFIMGTFCLVIPLIISNQIMYNNSLRPGPFSAYLLTLNHLITDQPSQLISIIPFRSLEIFINNVNVYFLILLNVVFATVPAAIIYISRYLHPYQKNIVYLLVIASVFWILYYSGGLYSGYSKDELVLNSSYTRYFLFPYIIVIMLGVFGIKTLITSRVILVLFSSLYVIASFSVLFESKYSMISYVNQQSAYRKTRDQFINATTSSSIIFTKYNDKIIYPYRNTALYPVIRDDNELNKTVQLVESILSNNITVYWIDEDWFQLGLPIGVYRSAFKKKDIEFIQVDKKLGLYQVKKV